MAAAITKIKNFLLGTSDEDYDDEYDEPEYEQEPEVTPRAATQIQNFPPRKDKVRGSGGSVRTISSNVVDLHKRTRIDINSPKNIENARDIIDNTRANIISVVNLEGVESAMAQRIADFLSGSVDALDGNIRRLSHDMFVITPLGVDITGDVAADIDEELSRVSIPLPWLGTAFGR